MADIVTGTVTGQVDETAVLMGIADVRREAGVNACDINKTTHDVGSKLTDQGTQYFIAGQQNAFSNATALAALKAATDQQFALTQAAIQLSAEKNAAATALASAATQALVTSDGAATRALINSQTIDELRAQLARAQDRAEDGGRGGRSGCCHKEPVKFKFGPPTGAVVAVEEG